MVYLASTCTNTTDCDCTRVDISDTSVCTCTMYFPQSDRWRRRSVIECVNLLPLELQRLFEHHSRLGRIIFLRSKDVFWKGQLSDSSNLTKGRTFAETRLPRHNPRLNHTASFYEKRRHSFSHRYNLPSRQNSVWNPEKYHAHGYSKFTQMITRICRVTFRIFPVLFYSTKACIVSVIKIILLDSIHGWDCSSLHCAIISCQISVVKVYLYEKATSRLLSYD